MRLDSPIKTIIKNRNNDKNNSDNNDIIINNNKNNDSEFILPNDEKHKIFAVQSNDFIEKQFGWSRKVFIDDSMENPYNKQKNNFSNTIIEYSNVNTTTTTTTNNNNNNNDLKYNYQQLVRDKSNDDNSLSIIKNKINKRNNNNNNNNNNKGLNLLKFNEDNVKLFPNCSDPHTTITIRGCC